MRPDQRRFPLPPVALLLVAALFVMTRWWVFEYPPPLSDVGLYWQYAYRFETAWHSGESFYHVHRKAVVRNKSTNSADEANKPLPAKLKVEYPPLALAVMIWPIFLVEERPSDPDEYSADEYDRLFRGFMAFSDVTLFCLTWLLIRRLFPREHACRTAARLTAYVLLGLTSWPVLYDRLDLFMTVLLVASVLLLVSRAPYFWSFLLLALAINYKLIPVVAAPVWLIGAVPLQRLIAARQERQYLGLFKSIAARSLVLAALTVLIFLPFYCLEGRETLGFLDYHRARPLEIGSTFSSLLLAMRGLGFPLEFSIEYGGLNVYSDLATALLKVSTALLVLVEGALTVFLVAGWLRQSASEREATSGTSIAASYPEICVVFTLAFLAAAMAVSKVFTSQYLILLFPFVVALPLPPRHNVALTLLCLACCLFTTWIFPFVWLHDILGFITFDEWPPPGPSSLGAAILELRSLTFVVFSVLLVYLSWRRFVSARQAA